MGDYKASAKRGGWTVVRGSVGRHATVVREGQTGPRAADAAPAPRRDRELEALQAEVRALAGRRSLSRLLAEDRKRERRRAARES